MCRLSRVPPPTGTVIIARRPFVSFPSTPTLSHMAPQNPNLPCLKACLDINKVEAGKEAENEYHPTARGVRGRGILGHNGFRAIVPIAGPCTMPTAAPQCQIAGYANFGPPVLIGTAKCQLPCWTIVPLWATLPLARPCHTRCGTVSELYCHQLPGYTANCQAMALIDELIMPIAECDARH